MDLQILPLAITMMVGPQIMAAILFLTAPKPVKISASFIAAVGIATTAGLIITGALAALLGGVSLGDTSNAGSLGNLIQYLLVGLLVVLAIKNYVNRETVEPPQWLGTPTGWPRGGACSTLSTSASSR
jgi:Sap, sulfolipid-1-addressing protein